MRRITHSRATLTIFISMVLIMVVAMTASITLAAMSSYGYGKNTVYIADLGTVACTTSVAAKLYPGGTSQATVHFNLPTEANHATKVKLTNFQLTSFTLHWGTNSSKSFTSVSNSNNSATVTTTAGAWTFALGLGIGLEVTAGTAKAATLTVTVPLGFDTSSTSNFGGSPNDGYLVGTVTSVDCAFTVDVEPIAA